MERLYIRIIPIILVLSCISITQAATCTFTGGGDGTSWSDDSNWSCGSEPDPSSDHVIIPIGFNVVNDTGDDFKFENAYDITINGSLDMEGKNLELADEDSYLTISNTGSLFDVEELNLNSGSDGFIDYGGNLTVEFLKVDDNSTLTIEAYCITVNSMLENLSDAGIYGTGCIIYNGTSGDFSNTGTGGIFGCFSSNPLDCPLTANLPIELLYFKVKSLNKKVLLTWRTASEINNDYFTIERSNDATNWIEIERIKGAGNSNTLLNYEAQDISAPIGVLYYKLKQTDFNGTYSYSKVERVIVEMEEQDKLIVLPNPASEQICIYGHNKEIGVPELYNIYGKIFKAQLSKMNKGMNCITLDISRLDKGVYFVRLGSKSSKFYVQ